MLLNLNAVDKVLTPLKSSRPYKGRFLYVLGCGRSGNTLLRKMLVEQLNMYIPAETYVIPEALMAFNRSKKLSWNEKVGLVLSFFEYHPEFATISDRTLRPVYDLCVKLPNGRRSFGDIIYELFQFIGKNSGFSFSLLGDKTPLNVLSIRLIYRHFPEANYLFITRHPYDVCYSYIRMGRYKSVEDAACRWRDSHENWFRFSSNKENKKLLTLRYEEFVQDPSLNLEKIQEWLMLEKRHEPVGSNAFWGDIGKYKHHKNVNSGVSVSSIGNGHSALSQNDKDAIDRIVGNLKSKFGHE